MNEFNWENLYIIDFKSLPVVKINEMGYLCIVQQDDECYVTKDGIIWDKHELIKNLEYL